MNKIVYCPNPELSVIWNGSRRANLFVRYCGRLVLIARAVRRDDGSWASIGRTGRMAGRYETLATALDSQCRRSAQTFIELALDASPPPPAAFGD